MRWSPWLRGLLVSGERERVFPKTIFKKMYDVRDISFCSMIIHKEGVRVTITVDEPRSWSVWRFRPRGGLRLNFMKESESSQMMFPQRDAIGGLSSALVDKL